MTSQGRQDPRALAQSSTQNWIPSSPSWAGENKRLKIKILANKKIHTKQFKCLTSCSMALMNGKIELTLVADTIS